MKENFLSLINGTHKTPTANILFNNERRDNMLSFQERNMPMPSNLTTLFLQYTRGANQYNRTHFLKVYRLEKMM